MDGVTNGYIPGDTLTIDPSLSLWQAEPQAVDPIAFEVIRHNLWHVNEEHGETIVKVSGSPIAVFGQDFNACILDARGDYVFFGPYYQVHAGIQDVSVKWVLEHRSANPGISDGDMFLHNDPWVGTLHQSDAMLLCPVFWEGKLLCWVGSVLHFADVGGPTPGGWCPDAESVYEEPLPTPPIKIVEGGVLRRDLEDAWVRRSRVPELVALDLRALIAGCTVARERVLELVGRYSAPTVTAVMRKVVDDAERRFVDKLARLPDGTWRERSYLEVARPGDRSAYPCYLTMRKDGDVLTFSSEGTSDTAGALNLTYAAWRGAILAAIGPLLCHDSLFAVGGALRHCRFEPAPGTMLCAEHPAAVSNGGAIGCLLTLALANNVLANMMACDDQLRGDLCAPTGLSQWPVTALYGTDQRGREFSTVILDWYLGTMGAQSFRDGVHTGGVYWGPYHLAPNIEQIERGSPVLYLYRRELSDGQGLGTYQSGAGPAAAWTPHGTDEITLNISCCGMAVPTAPGVSGGYPGLPNFLSVRQGTDLWPRIADGEMPQPDELAGERRVLGPKVRDLALRHGDVYEGWSAGGGGYGDPLDRDPVDVARDVADGYVSVDAALQFYGVTLTDEGQVEPQRTRAARDVIRERRLGHAPARQPEGGLDDDRVVMRAGQWLAVAYGEDGHSFTCARCGENLGPADADPKERMVRRDLPLSEAGLRFPDATRFLDENVAFRQFACPGCATALDHEIAVGDDPVLTRMQLRLGTLAAATEDTP
jgi:N-methylhydantoinase B